MSSPVKGVWSEADFDRMLWHDATIHALALHSEGLGESFQSRLLIESACRPNHDAENSWR